MPAGATAAYDPDRPEFATQGPAALLRSPDDPDSAAAREIEFDNAAAFAAAAAELARPAEMALADPPAADLPDEPFAAAGLAAEPFAAATRPPRSAGPDLIRADLRSDLPADPAGGSSDRQIAAERPDGVPGCTSPQLRRFIKSRAYVPMHELRRRFGIEGEDDDVSPIDVQATRVFAGLPRHESRLLGDLIRNGEIGYELSIDPETPILIGVYSMKPVSRS